METCLLTLPNILMTLSVLLMPLLSLVFFLGKLRKEIAINTELIKNHIGSHHQWENDIQNRLRNVEAKLAALDATVCSLI